MRKRGVENELEDRAVPAAIFSVNSITVMEGNACTQNALITVTLSERHANRITVNYSTANGTALAGSDFNAVSGKLTFAKNETSKTISIPVHGDRVAEPEEYFRVVLSKPTKGAYIGNGTAYINITDDEPRISIDDVSGLENHSGSATFTFTVSLATPYDQPVTVNYATADGAATAGSDYTAASGLVTFAPGQTSQLIQVQVHGDMEFEPNENFFVNLTNANSPALISKATGAGVIIDDEPRISIVSDNYNYGDYTPFTFTVSLPAPSTEVVTVDFTTVNGTANAGVDYVFTSGTLTFQPGVTSLQISVEVLNPFAYDLYFTAQLSNASANALIGADSAVGYWYYDCGCYGGGYDYWYYDYYYYW